jgi:DNA-directed RNA polymerase sigma subunit (sigma70/sigma32)
LPEDLFPAPFLRRALQTNRVTRDVDAESLQALMHQAPPSIAYDPERSLIVKEAVDSLIAALDTIKTGDGQSDARNIAVLKHYYGLEGGEASTLEATAKHFGVTRERVRQILHKVEWRLKRKLNSPQYKDAKSAMLEMM